MSRTAEPAIKASAEVMPGAVASEGRRVRLKVIKDGKTQTIEWPAATDAEAIRQAAAKGWRVLDIESPAQASQAARSGARAAFPLLLFSQELLALLDAGLNLTEALATLHAKQADGPARDLMLDVLQAVREGRNYSDVLATHPAHFPEVYVATVKAAERTGDLPQALARYIAYQLQFDALKKKLVSAAIYPVMLLVVGGFVTLFLLGYVVPRFSAVYESSGRPLPWLSMTLLSFGKLIYSHWQIALLAFISLLGLTGWAASRPAGRQWLTAQVLRLPMLARKASEFRMARFFRAVSLLLAAGIPLSRAMGMVTGLLAPSQQRALAQARTGIEQGLSLSAALQAAGLSSPVADSLIKVGERSGQMAEMLERTARFHDEDFGRWVDWASRLLEPILMAVIGLVIGTVVVLMYMPIFELAGSLQ
jgi:general secretion pathway protein F